MTVSPERRAIQRQWRCGGAAPLALLALALACTEPSDAPSDDDLNAEEKARAAGQREFESVRTSFGPLRTLAGAGVHGDDTNDWLAHFEGGPATLAELSTPHNALADAAGRIYIADKDAHAIRRVELDGTIHTFAGINEPGDDGDTPGIATERRLDQPNGLWVNPDSSIYILDLGNRKVRRVDENGTVSTLFTAPTLRTGRGLWVSPDATLAYVCSGQEVLRWTPSDGVHVFQDGFVDLGNLYLDARVGLVVTDRGAGRAYRLREDGKREPLAGDGTPGRPVDGAPALRTGVGDVRGVWRHPVGGWLLATHAGSQVLYLDTRGYIHVLIDGSRGAHSGDGQPLTEPGAKVSEVRNVTMTPSGELLVTEHDFGFIRITSAARSE